MTAWSGSTPVQWRIPIAPWPTSIPRPSSTVQPRASASAIRFVRGGFGITSATTISAAGSRRRGRRGRRRGVALTTMSASVRDGERAAPLHELGGRRRPLRHQRRELLAAPAIAVDDRHRARAGQRRLDRDRARGAAGAQHDERAAGGVGDRPQRGEEALAVGVLADVAAVAAHDAVDRADHLGGLREPVEVLDHRDLVRDRAVEAGPAHGAGAAHRVAERVGRHLAVEIAGVEAVVAVGGLDHRHGRVLARRRRERAGEQAEEAQGRSSS